MSADALIWVAHLKALTLAERGILQKLAQHAHVDGSSAHPSVATMAAWAGLQERNVRLVLNRLLARKLIVVEGSNGRRGGGRQPTIYRVVMSADFDRRTWREADVQAWQDLHIAPAPVKARQAREGGNNRHATEARGAKSDTLGGHSIAPEPKREPLVRKDNRSALPRRPRGGPDEGAIQDRDAGVQQAADERAEAQEQEAMRLLLAMQPMNSALAQIRLYGLKLRYDYTWEPVINALIECGQLHPPLAKPMRWLTRHANRARKAYRGARLAGTEGYGQTLALRPRPSVRTRSTIPRASASASVESL